jgi:Uma2 family endonuclease
MATQPKTSGLTYEDLRSFPDDNLRREIIDGELFVTPSPIPRHQRVVGELFAALLAYAKAHGGDVYPAPLDVFLSDTNVVEPDVLFIRPEHVDTTDRERITSIPDLVIEVSSPTTRRTDLTRKKDLYERFAVPEYWFVDLDAERVEAYRLREERYGQPEIVRVDETLTSSALPGFAFDLSEILGLGRD